MPVGVAKLQFYVVPWGGCPSLQERFTSLVNRLALPNIMFQGKILVICHRRALIRYVLIVRWLLFMQEEALATEFTIKETMYYFGIIFEMNFKYIRQRAEFLKGFLDLPSLSQLCGTLRLVTMVI